MLLLLAAGLLSTGSVPRSSVDGVKNLRRHKSGSGLQYEMHLAGIITHSEAVSRVRYGGQIPRYQSGLDRQMRR